MDKEKESVLQDPNPSEPLSNKANVDSSGSDNYEDPLTSPSPYSSPKYTLILLTIINGLNYCDRYIPSSVKDLIKADLNLTDTQTSIPLSAFIIVYMIFCPIFSHFSDKGYSRTKLLCLGISVWSLATAASAFVNDFWTFLISRAAVGIGEAAYSAVAPTILCDLYPSNDRNAALSIFYLAIPVGAALGYGLGSGIASILSWRYSFLLCSAPGLIAAALVYLLKEPKMGGLDILPQEDLDEESPSHHQNNFNTEISNQISENNNNNNNTPNVDSSAVINVPSWKETTISLYYNRNFFYSTIGLIFLTFGAGGMADWVPTYLSRVYDISVGFAGLAVGGVTVIAGVGGTWTGFKLANKARDSLIISNPYLFVSASSLGLCAIFALIMLLMPIVEVAIAFLLLAEFFLWFYSGPIFALCNNSVSPLIRARSSGIQSFLIHILGDAVSPTILGFLSDSTNSLKGTFIIIPAVFLCGSIFWFIGWRRVGAGSSAGPGSVGSGYTYNPLDDNPPRLQAKSFT